MKTLFTLGLVALMASPTMAQTCQLTGDIAGLGNQPLLYWYTRQGERHTDTVRVTKGHFTLLAKRSDDGKGALYIPGKSSYTTFWLEPGKLLVQGDAAQPGKIRVTGTPENQVRDEYARTVDWKYDAYATKDSATFRQVQAQNYQATRHFIATHPAARTSADLLYEQLMTNQRYPLTQYEQLWQQLAPGVRQSVQGQRAAKRLLVLRQQPKVGKPVANFTVADTAGVPHTLATYRGRYVLLDFWGHWCGPCLQAMPKVKALHAQYGQRLALIGIGMENKDDASAWKQAIRTHEVPGLQLSELQGDEGPIITGYNITAFPTYLLLDPQGVRVLSTNDVDDVSKKLATMGAL